MSEKPSRLTEEDRDLVLDASGAINILGTGRPADVLAALGRPCIVEANAWREIKRDPISGLPAEQVLKKLASLGLLLRQEMNSNAAAQFLELVLAPPPDGLDDGEAASIAHAIQTGGSVVIDERKALRICASSFPSLRTLSTLDLLSSEAVKKVLGASLADAVYSSLTYARMRVPVEYSRWAIRLIGVDRARTCPGLSRYLT